MTNQEFHSKFDQYLLSGDEKGARKFILDNYLDLPADMQESLAWSFLGDAAAYAERESASLAGIQQSTLEALETEVV